MFVQVYDKGHNQRPHGLAAPHLRVTPLRNVGREGRTWLEHVIRHYDNLAEWTYLAQGEPHQPPGEFLRRLQGSYADTTGLTREYLPDFPPRWIKDRDVVEWHAIADGGPPVEVRYGRAIYQGGRTQAENEPWLRRLWAYFFACPVPDPIEDWVYAYGAMYAVPRRRITDRPLAFWEWCHDVIARPEHQVEHSWGSGYAFELIWLYLFGDASRYPVRVPPTGAAADLNRTRAQECRHSDGSCGCDGRSRNCTHPRQIADARLSAHCYDCPFKAFSFE